MEPLTFLETAEWPHDTRTVVITADKVLEAIEDGGYEYLNAKSGISISLEYGE